MNVSIVLSAFAVLFLAEMGDKTQLIAMTLAHRYRLAPVIAGVFAAFLILNLLAVWVGAALYRFVPLDLTLFAAGILFLVFAYLYWRDSTDQDEDDDQERTGGRTALLASFSLIFLAELGDKTQLALIAMVAASGEIWSVFLGATLALWSVSLIAILLGARLLRLIPKVWVQRVAALLFLAFGLIAIGQVVVNGVRTVSASN